ncbi:MAG TPA: cation:proton antiporter [Smithellaceae bacterium]|nr:cation:proton antiporter [Smithellaceae bacterium]
MHELLPDIGISILAATIIGFIFQMIRQPIILGYLIAGAVIGPKIGFHLISATGSVDVISEIGLILLLFVIGLELNLRSFISAGKQLIVAGIGQFLLCVLIGFGFFTLIGYSFNGGSIASLYLAIFCALSSTAIVVKLLYDKAEIDTLPGRITVGILIFQDIWAILVLALQPHLTNPQLYPVALALGKSFVLLTIGFLLSKYLLKWAFEKITKTPEVVVGMSIAWCVFMAGLASTIGLSMEMGALIAGIAISSFPYGLHIIAKVLPLRDFFLTLFFVSIGMKIPAPDASVLCLAGVIVVFVFVSRFVTVYPLLAITGSGRRTSFIASLNLSQISEFSLVIATLGIAYGHIKDDLATIIIYAMAFTSILSSYIIKGNHQLFLLFDNILRRAGFAASRDGEEKKKKENSEIILLGCHRGGLAFLERLELLSPELLKKVLVVDFNQEVLQKLDKRGIKGVFGDISSMDTLAHAHIEHAAIILLTIPDMLLKSINNVSLIKICRALAPEAVIVATAESEDQIEAFREAGATEVLLPYSLIGENLADFVAKNS